MCYVCIFSVCVLTATAVTLLPPGLKPYTAWATRMTSADEFWVFLGFFPPAFSILPQGWQHLTGKLTMGRSAFLVINFCGIFMCTYFGDTGSQLVKLKGKCNSLKVLWSLRFKKKKGWSNLWKCEFFENILLKKKEGKKKAFLNLNSYLLLPSVIWGFYLPQAWNCRSKTLCGTNGIQWNISSLCAYYRCKKNKNFSPSFHVQFCKRGTKKENQRKNTGEFKMWDVGLMGIWKKKYKKNAVNQIWDFR